MKIGNICTIDNNKIAQFYLDNDAIRDAIYIEIKETEEFVKNIYLMLKENISSDITLNFQKKNFKFNMDNVYIDKKTIIIHAKGVTITNE